MLSNAGVIKMLKLSLFLAACSFVFAQEPADQSEKAPDGVDEALRSRIDQFYQAHVSGRFREAIQLVADDSLDAFLEGGRNQYKACQTVKVTYTDNFQKAKVLESCKSEYKWHHLVSPVTLPLDSYWKIIDGQWFWYYVKPTEVLTPWGISKVTPENSENPQGKTIPKDPTALADNILGMVKIDKRNVSLRSNESSKEEILLSNGMPGSVTFSIDPIAIPGVKITPMKGQVNAKEQVAIVIEYKVDDATITCGDCAKRLNTTFTPMCT